MPPDPKAVIPVGAGSRAVLRHVIATLAYRASKVLRDAPPSIYLDTSGSVMDNGLLERCVRDFGADRLLFGTDMTMEGNVARVRDADIPEPAREKIFFRNFEAVLARRRAG